MQPRELLLLAEMIDAAEQAQRLVDWSVDLEILHATAGDDLPGYVAQLKAVFDQLQP